MPRPVDMQMIAVRRSEGCIERDATRRVTAVGNPPGRGGTIAVLRRQPGEDREEF